MTLYFRENSVGDTFLKTNVISQGVVAFFFRDKDVVNYGTTRGSLPFSWIYGEKNTTVGTHLND